jgi:hypothetical protein
MSDAAERFIDVILAGEPPEMIRQMARRLIEKKTRTALERRRADWMSRDVPCDEYADEFQSEMSLEEFISDAHRDLDREINETVEVLNERAGGLHYNALPKIHQTLISAGFKHVQSNNRLHHYHNDVSGHPADGMHVVASWAGYKLRLRSGEIVTGRHYKHLQKHLAKYSGAEGGA